MSMQNDLAVIGISYSDSSRLSGFNALVLKIDKALNVKHTLLLWQPNISIVHTQKMSALVRADIYFTRFGYRKMFRQIESRFQAPLRTRLLREVAFLTKLPLLLRYLFPSHRRLRTELRSREIFLNAKHRHAWINFLEGDSELLLVLEDDVSPIDPLWSESLLDAIEDARLLTSRPAILNLAPFFDLQSLLPELIMVEASQMKNWMRFHFFANTTAAYIINRHAAEALLGRFLASPKHALESIDFAMTTLGLSVATEIEYWERNPVVFQNLSQVDGGSSLGN